MFRSLFKGFIYSNLFVALILASLTLSSYAIVDQLEFHFYVPLSVFLGSFVLYTFHRLYKIDFIPIDQLAERHQWVLRRSEAMKYAMSFAVFGLMLLLPSFEADTVVWLVPAGIVSVGYTIPILPSRYGWRRFRDIPLTKPLIIAVVVSYLTLAYPVFEQRGIHAIFHPGFVQLFFERVLFVVVVTIPFDIRDIMNDRDAGIYTFGTAFGFERARQIGYIFIAAWLVSALMQYLVVGRSVEALIASIFMTGWVLVTYYFMKPRWSDLRYILIFEGAIVVYAVIYTLGALFQITP